MVTQVEPRVQTADWHGKTTIHQVKDEVMVEVEESLHENEDVV